MSTVYVLQVQKEPYEYRDRTSFKSKKEAIHAFNVKEALRVPLGSDVRWRVIKRIEKTLIETSLKETRK